MKKPVNYTSPSQIGTFLTCPLAYKQLYLDGAERESANIYMDYGTAIHYALARNNYFKKATKGDKSLSEVVSEFKFKFLEETQKNKLEHCVDETVRRSLVLEGENTLENYMKYFAPDIMPLEVEYKFEIALKHFPITIMGFIDLITEDGFIWDYKTVGKSYKTQWNQRTVDSNMQLTCYSAAYRKLMGKEEKGVCIALLPRMTPYFETIDSFRTQDQILQFLNLATDIEKIIELGVFMPFKESCPQCQFKNTCTKRLYIEQKTLKT
jgi:putative RecB family exonuclease